MSDLFEPDIEAMARLLSRHLTPTWEELVELGEADAFIEEAQQLWRAGIGGDDV